MAKSPAWTRKEGKNPKGGLNAKGKLVPKDQGPIQKDQFKSVLIREEFLLPLDLAVWQDL